MPNTIRNAGAGLAFALLAGLLGCGHTGEPAASAILRRGLSGEPSTLDPASVADSFSNEVAQDLYEGLTAESTNGDVIPGVALSWTVDPSGMEYTFQLRPDARWSNGKPVRASEFVASWRRVVDPKQGSPVADDLRLIAGASAIISGTAPASSLGVEAPTDSVLIVKLEKPAPYLPQLLTHVAACPVYSDSSARSHDPNTWISNGPYVLSGWSPGTSVKISQNPFYWDRKSVHIPRVEFQVISDENSQYARYRAGQLDMTDTVPPNAVGEIRKELPTELFIAPFLATAYYGLNLSSGPLASNVKLRQALAMAIDRKHLIAALAFGQQAAYGFVPPGTWNYTSQSWQWKNLGDAERVAEAKRLYAEAGYSISAPLHLRVLFNANPVIRNTAVMVASMWKETLGIETALADEEYRVFLQTRHDKSRWEVARLAWTADYDDATDFLDIFRAKSANNDVDYANRSFDALLDEAARSVELARRRRLLEASEQMLLADYPVLPLYFFVSKRLIKRFVLGVQLNPLNHIYSKELTIQDH
jgi:oligopeptide transport system substrate-binding protein